MRVDREAKRVVLHIGERLPGGKIVDGRHILLLAQRSHFCTRISLLPLARTVRRLQQSQARLASRAKSARAAAGAQE